VNFLKEILIYLLSSGVGILLIISSSFIAGQGKSLTKITKTFGVMLFILGSVLLVVNIVDKLLTFIFALY